MIRKKSDFIAAVQAGVEEDASQAPAWFWPLVFTLLGWAALMVWLAKARHAAAAGGLV